MGVVRLWCGAGAKVGNKAGLGSQVGCLANAGKMRNIHQELGGDLPKGTTTRFCVDFSFWHGLAEQGNGCEALVFATKPSTV